MKQVLYERLVQYIVENQNRFYRIAYSYTGHQEDALDAVQTAVCKALESYETIKDENALRTWFYRILIHECLNVLKKRKKQVWLADYKEEKVYMDSSFEQETYIKEELNKLEMDMQTIIKLRFFEELSLKEIASIMDMKLNTVKTKLYRGLKLLKENIKEADLWEN